jgi:hypothetical protein
MSRRGNGGGAMDHQARYNVGALEQRVYGLEQSISGISQQIAGLSQKIDAGRQTNWGVLISIAGFSLAFAGAVGGLAYMPIREAQSDMKVVLARQTEILAGLGDRFVSIREVDARGLRTQTELVRINTDLTAQEVNLRRSMEQADTNLQRQIDEQKKAFGDTFSLRDALLQMQRRIDQLEAARRAS